MSFTTNGFEDLHGAAASADSLKQILDAYKQTKQHDELKNQIIEELLIRYEYHLSKYEADQAIVTYAKKLELENIALHEHVKRMSSPSTQFDDEYIFVLLDGNGMIFEESFLRMGTNGALQATDALMSYVKKHTFACQPPFNRNVKVVIRIYADAYGIADILRRFEVVSEQELVVDFYHALSHSMPNDVLCDFVDSDPSQHLAVTKIKDVLDFHVHDHRCLQIYLGCSHDAAYTDLIGQYSEDIIAKARLALIDAPSLPRKLLSFPFRHVVFGTLFSPNLSAINALDSVPTAKLAPIGTRPAVNPAVTPAFRSYTNTPAAGTPLTGTPASFIGTSLRSHRLSSATTMSSELHHDAKEPEGRKSWAKLAEEGNRIAQIEAVKAAAIASQQKREAEKAAAESKKNTVPLAKAGEVIARGVIPRNKNGQRIDPPVRSYDRTHVNRVRNFKWCLVHFLTPEGCPYKKCQHRHAPAPSADDLEWLRLVARLQPCNKVACDDLHCCYGHRCLAPVKGGAKTGINCIIGEDCKFGEAHHNVDTTIVKTLTI